MDDNRIYRVAEVAAYLGVSRSKVYELVRSGRLPSVKIDGVRRVRGADVMAFIERHVVAA
ncbi:helix-turn-helix domain-containing protein [Arsenicicoccus dermatophilus]|uniref:helix-turn-helix domain-containing protein n=1 Tax=Arsenicicoccus dermatophilus TaxID=1076331 RepID=UPI001F4C90CC|nr:helix-turn-helix domain-containing protein [Arsenicicoccus dermatophilus]MCH8611902.1 helix-turn-helix domain-containing protein [Arsenicicoccus dermatophilus]